MLALQTVLVARMCTGMARAVVDYKHKCEGTSEEGRIQSFLERCFIEIVGTASQIGVIHLVQDIAAKCYENSVSFQPGALAETLKIALDAEEHDPTLKKDVVDAFKKVVGPSSENMFDRLLYSSQDKLSLEEVAKLVNQPLSPKVQAALEEVFTKINRAGSNILIASVLAGAFFGGVILQLVNDYLFAPKIAPLIKRAMGVSLQKPTQAGTALFTPQPIQGRGVTSPPNFNNPYAPVAANIQTTFRW